ncbi:MAG: hypothetical protein ACI4PF_04510 [Christensenellales bacterium]
MAERKINKDNIIKIADGFSRNMGERLRSSFVSGLSSLSSKIGLSRAFTTMSKDKSANVDKLMELASKNPEMFDAGMFKEEVLVCLNNKQLNAIYDMMSKVKSLTDRASELKDDKYLAEKNSELAKMYKLAIDEMSPYFEGVNLSEMFGSDSIDKTLKEMDNVQLSEGYSAPIGKGLPSPSKADLELVAAFKMLDVDLYLDHSNKWIISNEQKAKYKQKTNSMEERFRFNQDEVQSLLDGYLNKPLNERNGQLINPEGLFKVYRQRGLQIINEDNNLNNDEQKLLTTNLEEMCNRFSTEGQDWEINLLINPNIILRNAQQLAFAEISQEKLQRYNSTILPSFSDSLREQVDNSEMPDAIKEFKRLATRFNSRAIEANDYIIDHQPQGIVNFESEYETQINILKSRQKALLSGTPSPKELGELESKIKMLETAQQQFRVNVDFMKSFINSQVGPNANKEQVLDSLHNVENNYWIKSNGGDFVLMDRHSGENPTSGAFLDTAQKAKEDALNALKARILGKNTTENQSLINEALKSFDANAGILDYLMLNDDKEIGFAKSMDSMYKLKLAEILFAEGAPLDIEFNKYKKNNPNKTIDDFIDENFSENNADNQLFDKVSLKAGYERNINKIDNNFKISDKSKQHINNTYDAYNRNLVLLDRIMNSFSDEELQKFNDPTTPATAKYALINDKIKKAKQDAKNNPINAVPGNKEFENAKARHNNKVLGTLLSKDLNNIIESEKESGSEPILSNTIQKYLDSLKGGQAKQQDQDKLKEEMKKTPKSKWPKYGDFRQKTVDQIKFEKAMKGYSSKELKKRFIKLLLKGLKADTPFNVEEYRKKNAEKNAQRTQTPNKQQINDKDGQEHSKEAQPEDSSVQQSKDTQPDKAKLKQREFEASAFLPGLCMVEKAIEEVAKKGGDKTRLKDLQYTLKCLASIDVNDANKAYSVTRDGMDFRDACRQIAFSTCKGELKDVKAVQEQLNQAITKYSIPDNEFTKQLKQGFSNLTPDLMEYLFEFSSESKQHTNKDGETVNYLTLGNLLPRGLDACKTDAERKELIKNDMEKRIDYQSSADLLNLLISEGGFDRNKDIKGNAVAPMQFEDFGIDGGM